jgi:hypothetical protein
MIKTCALRALLLVMVLALMGNSSSCGGGSHPLTAVVPSVESASGLDPTTGGDPAARLRIQSQLPHQSGTTEINSVISVNFYVVKLVIKDPEAQAAFRFVQFLNGCAYSYGLYAGRAFVDTQLQYAGAIVVFSYLAMHSVAQIAMGCMRENFGLPNTGNGGPTSGPCLRRYYYATTTRGVADTYYVFIAGTRDDECAALANTYTARPGVMSF